MEKHLSEECKSAIKCTECKAYVSNDKKKIIPHNCVEYLKNKVDTLSEAQEIQEIEFKENLRVRDIKIKSLLHQQRQFWKYLTKIERKVYGTQSNLRMPSPVPDNTLSENLQEVNDQQEGSELDFYAFYENEVLDANYQNSEQTESITDKDSNRSTQKSDTGAKLTEIEIANLDFQSKTKPQLGTKTHRKSEETKDEVRIKVESENESDDKDTLSDHHEAFKEKELFSNLEPIKATSFPVDREIIKQKTKLLAELKDLSNWKKSTKKNGVEVLTYNGDEGNYTGLMGVMELPFNHNDIFQALCEPEIPFNANPFADRMEVLENIDDDTMVIYMKFKGMMLVNGRDFILLSSKVLIDDQNSPNNTSQVLMTYSVDHPKSPEVPKSIVRADMLVAGWICTKIDENRTIVVNMAINDLKGIIPKFVINAGASTHTNLLVNIKKKLEEMKEQGLLYSQTKRKEDLNIKIEEDKSQNN